jgi:hypothetical protein
MATLLAADPCLDFQRYRRPVPAGAGALVRALRFGLARGAASRDRPEVICGVLVMRHRSELPGVRLLKHFFTHTPNLLNASCMAR